MVSSGARWREIGARGGFSPKGRSIDGGDDEAPTTTEL